MGGGGSIQLWTQKMVGHFWLQKFLDLYVRVRSDLVMAKEKNVDIMWSALHVNHASVLCIIDKAMKRYIKPHHEHIGSLLAYFLLRKCSLLICSQWNTYQEDPLVRCLPVSFHNSWFFRTHPRHTKKPQPDPSFLSCKIHKKSNFLLFNPHILIHFGKTLMLIGVKLSTCNIIHFRFVPYRCFFKLWKFNISLHSPKKLLPKF